MTKTPKILTYGIIIFIIFNTFSFLFLKLAYAPTRADDQVWKIPELQIKISDNQKIAEFTSGAACTGNSSKICTQWIAQYIASIYRYAVGIIGILAVVVMMVGGIMWIIAGGNTSTISSAKAWLEASITGLILTLCSYLILAQINPALIKFGALGIGVPTARPSEVAAPAAGPSTPCQMYSSNNIIDYNKVTNSTPLPAACSNYNFNSYGRNAKILQAIAAAESSCNPNAQSSAGSCGIMQLMPSTAGRTCQELKDNPNLSIQIANDYINNNATSHGWNIYRELAGYNSGYSTGTDPATGKKGGLAPSTDCPSVSAYQCCINPGGLVETQNYVMSALQYYNSLP